MYTKCMIPKYAADLQSLKFGNHLHYQPLFCTKQTSIDIMDHDTFPK